MNHRSKRPIPIRRPHQQAESMSELQKRRLARIEKHFENLESGLEEFEAMVQEKLPKLGIELEEKIPAKSKKTSDEDKKKGTKSDSLRRSKPR